MGLKVLSWNIWYDGDLAGVNVFLEKSGADIIGLQEVVRKDNIIQLSNHLMEIYAYKTEFTPAFTIEKEGAEVEVGNIILSKFPILSSSVHRLPDEEDKRNVIEAKIRAGDTTFRVFNTHLLHTHQKPSKIQELQAETIVKLLPKEKTILMGDFNALPDSIAIKKINKIMINTDSKLKPTWSAYPEGCKICMPQNIIFKLDNIFTSPDLKAKSFKVESSKASDHLPISAEIL